MVVQPSSGCHRHDQRGALEWELWRPRDGAGLGSRATLRRSLALRPDWPVLRRKVDGASRLSIARPRRSSPLAASKAAAQAMLSAHVEPIAGSNDARLAPERGRPRGATGRSRTVGPRANSGKPVSILLFGAGHVGRRLRFRSRRCHSRFPLDRSTPHPFPRTRPPMSRASTPEPRRSRRER